MNAVTPSSARGPSAGGCAASSSSGAGSLALLLTDGTLFEPPSPCPAIDEGEMLDTTDNPDRISGQCLVDTSNTAGPAVAGHPWRFASPRRCSTRLGDVR